MHPSSMTGFGAFTTSTGSDGDQFRWELRSVNAKGLDIRLKLPSGFEVMEPQIKRHIQKRFTRGSIQANCALVKSDHTLVNLELNEAAIKTYVAQRKALEDELGPFAPLDFEKIALDTRFQAPKDAKASVEDRAQDDLMAALTPAIDALEAARLSEGHKLQTVLLSIIDQIHQTLGQILSHKDNTASHQAARLQMQIESVIGAYEVDKDRIAQELTLIATKADIREETDRLEAHCQEAKTLLNSAKPIGRRLDFLAQEFSREANTLCAKAATNDITRLGLDLKTMIDQFKEQTQNIE